MTGMPERIWADWTETWCAVEIGTWADTIRFSKQQHEYVRADVHDAVAADLALARELIALLEEAQERDEARISALEARHD